MFLCVHFVLVVVCFFLRVVGFGSLCVVFSARCSSAPSSPAEGHPPAAGVCGEAAHSSPAEPWVPDVLQHSAFTLTNQIKMLFCCFAELIGILISLQLEVLIAL